MHLYVDIGISAILVLALIIGIIRGFTKQFVGGFCWLIGLVGSIGLTLLIVPALASGGILNGFSATATGWFAGDEFVMQISSYDDLLAALSTSNFLSILKADSISQRIWTTMSQSEMSTLGAYFGAICAKLITGFVIWIVLLLIFKLIFWGVKKGLNKLSKLPVLHTLDRIFGAIWSLAIAYVIIVVFVTTAVEIVIVKFTPAETLDAFRNVLNNSAVFQALHDTNVIGAYLAKLLNVDLATLAPIV